ncbi:MAG: DEAD/DEAH box helicase [Candidatus Nanopelagicales bacterium]
MATEQQPATGGRAPGAHEARSIYDILDELRSAAGSQSHKGRMFERLVKAFLRTDPLWVDQFDEVWLWSEYPGRGDRQDTGIDLVARGRSSGLLTAVQAKFYGPETRISKADIDSFLSASGTNEFAGRLVVSSTDHWGSNAEAAVKDQQVPVRRIGMTDLETSAIDWGKFSLADPEALSLRDRKVLRPHQVAAISAVRDGFRDHDRGKLVLACGTGKTLTSLRLAEQMVGAGGSVLFLVPSIALLSQSLREWTNEAEVDLNPIAVCSDPRVSQRSDVEDISIIDLALPASTDAAVVASRIAKATVLDAAMTVVFSTYQSIDVVARAQAEHDLPPFDIVVCDEAHRTTGVTLAEADESAFVRVHDAEYVKANKRLYMTATPRIYDDSMRAKAGLANAVLASMDDEAIFGPEFYRLGFGEAVSLGLLADYKVLVLAVDEGSVAKTFQDQFADENNELRLNDYSKIIGCWNGLAKRGHAEHTFGADPSPMSRAVAFAGNIKDSKRLERLFPSVVDQYIEAHDLDNTADEDVIRTAVQHVDGGMGALERNGKLDWLKRGAADDTCRILTNARCLSEGVDVPALEAVLFLSPRKSVVDIVQSVGRVMRRAEGKTYGYIILPIGIPAGMTPEAALADNARYKVVWDVLQALRAHDERFDAMINKIELNKSRDDKINIIGVRDGEDGDGDEKPRETQGEFTYIWPELDNLRDAIYARIVAKVGNRRYWEQWAKDIAVIADAHVTRINALLDSPTSPVAAQFERFLEGLRGNLNDSITRADAVDMLAQHLITRPVFDALFEGYEFTKHNPVAQAMQVMLDALDAHNLDDENASLEKFYDSVRLRAAGIDNAEGRQKIIVELYDKFFTAAFPATVAKLGIVYTPIEVVDFILRSADWALREEFGYGVSDEGVHVLDGFTGTGTFMVRLIQSGLIAPHDLARKFTSELHANEFLLLAYYIAAINIETAFHDLAERTVEEYEPFPGLVLTDTFQSYEEGDLDDVFVFLGNNDRINRQRAVRDIRVIVGNPPYSSGQDSANDNNANERYPFLDSQIRAAYEQNSRAQHTASLYDSYIRAIRWATERIGDRGVIAFVTNGGWLDSLSADGMRKKLVEEFSKIYVFNLRGNQLAAGEVSRREGGKIFGGGSRTTIAVFLLVKNPEHSGPADVLYRDIGDYLSREDKLAIIRDSGHMGNLEFTRIEPNEDGDWINQRSAEFQDLFPLSTSESLGKAKGPTSSIFELNTGCPLTSRDSWVYNFSAAAVERNVRATVDYFNELLPVYADTRAAAGAMSQADFERGFYSDPRASDPKRISWDEKNKRDLAAGRAAHMDPANIRVASYRPFMKQHLYLDRAWNNSVYQIESAFPHPNLSNYGFYVVGKSSKVPFAALMTDAIPDRHFTGAGSGGQFFPRYVYRPADAVADTLFASDALAENGFVRVDNITDRALVEFQRRYGQTFDKDSIFFYLYGLLHSREYAATYDADLKKLLPRVPFVDDPTPFVEAGARLSALHIGYESAPVFPLTGLPAQGSSAEDLRVERLRYRRVRDAAGKLGDDKTTIIVNSQISLSDVPEAAQQYMVGAKSALDWVVERYRDEVDRASGLRNDANAWGVEQGDPRYVVDLVGRVTSVSLETVQIVDALPKLRVTQA